MSAARLFAQTTWVCLGLFFLAGCGSKSDSPAAPFETFDVAGKVIYKNAAGDTEALDRAKVWFQSKSKPDLLALGAVSDDGSFVMTVVTKNQTWAGVPEGDYRVRIEPPADEETRMPQSNVIHAKYQNFDSSGLSVRVPVSGELTFVVEPPARGGS